ncbi:hypothetical protein CH274_15570 [Rhodococcus sp. 06-418-5]|uniref:hypothetical protein n=1 Tax=Rhodococcus sp. 06-418-5 TaxID=2022507 RepID=UPI000B9C2D30|nr:hypothetical protein [Rhodococcus sp. 06-418-5]OZC80587.1 hypothetical protein CH274_15570 [Rhodococcus sp. 06-418-5]
MTAVVIRAWDARHNPVGYAVAPFVDGEFIVPGNDPLARMVRQDYELISFFTVLTTDELQWRLISTEHLAGHEVKFRSRPWISELRRTLRSDQWFVENVIEPAGGSAAQR